MKTSYVLLVLGWILVWGINTAMAAPPVQNDAGREYTVQPGDCLAKIAERFLGSQHFWPAIWQATNMRAMADSRFTLIRDPGLIYSGQTIWLPNIDEAELLLPQTGPPPAPSVSEATTGLLAVDIKYIGDLVPRHVSLQQRGCQHPPCCRDHARGAISKKSTRAGANLQPIEFSR